MPKIRMKDAVTESIDLCASCQNSGIRKHEDGSILRICRYGESDIAKEWRVITKRVEECKFHTDGTVKSEYEYREIAWQMVKNGTKITFVSPNEFQAMQHVTARFIHQANQEKVSLFKKLRKFWSDLREITN